MGDYYNDYIASKAEDIEYWEPASRGMAAPATSTPTRGSTDSQYSSYPTPPSSGRKREGRINFRQEYWENNQPIMENVTWQTVTTQIPKLPPINENNKNIKLTCFNRLTSRIEDSSGKWIDKSGLLFVKFSKAVPAAEAETNIAIKDFQRPVSDIFAYRDGTYLTSTFTDVPVPAFDPAAPVDFTAVERQQIKWFKFNLNVDARLVNTSNFNLTANRFPSTRTFPAYVRVQLAGDEMDPFITKQRMSTLGGIREVINNYLRTGEEWAPCWKSTVDGTPEQHKMQEYIREVKEETRFKAGKQIIERLYIGYQQGITSLRERISRISATYWDTNRNKRAYRTIDELANKYQTELNFITPLTPRDDLPNLEMTFYSTLPDNLKNKLNSTLHNRAPQSVAENLEWFNEFRAAAKIAERDIEDVMRIARSSQTGFRNTRTAYDGTNRRMPGTYHAASMPPDQPSIRREDTQPSLYQGQLEQANPKMFLGSTNRNDQEDTEAEIVYNMCYVASSLQEEEWEHKTLLSDVERGMQQASGMLKPIKCFGCDGIYDDCWHLWSKCPRRSEKQVWQNFRQNLHAFRQRREQQKQERQTRSPYGPAAPRTEGNWKQQGYPNKATKEQITAIANPATSTEVRKTLLAALTDKLTTAEEDEEEEENLTRRSKRLQEGKVKTMYNKEGKKTRAYIAFPMESKNQITSETRKVVSKHSTFLAPQTKRKYEFSMAFKLPHVRLPIGDGRGPKTTLEALWDTGGCCLMGNLTYFQALYNKCPNLFFSFLELQEERYENIIIGGIKDGIALTHMAALYVPFEEQGIQMSLQFGLSVELPVDVLIGVLWQKQMKFNTDLGLNMVTSSILRRSFPILWKQPCNKPIENIESEARMDPRMFLNIEDETDNSE